MGCKFTCKECGHQNTFEPSEWPWVLRVQPDEQGAPERVLYRRVRCGGCGREQEVPVERK